MKGTCEICGKTKNVHPTKIVEVKKTFPDSGKLFLSQRLVATFMVCRSCRFWNRATIKLPSYILLIGGIVASNFDLHQNQYTVGGICFAGLVINMFFIFYYNMNNIPEKSNKLRLQLIEKGAIAPKDEETDYQYEIRRMLYINPIFSFVRLYGISFIGFLFIMISSINNTNTSFELHKKLGIADAEGYGEFRFERKGRNYTINIPVGIIVEGHQYIKKCFWFIETNDHRDSTSLAYFNDSTKTVIAESIDAGLDRFVAHVQKVLIEYDSTDASNTENWKVFLEKSDFENNGYNMQATFKQLGIDSTQYYWRGYLDLIHLTGILKNDGRGAFIDTVRKRNNN